MSVGASQLTQADKNRTDGRKVDGFVSNEPYTEWVRLIKAKRYLFFVRQGNM